MMKHFVQPGYCCSFGYSVNVFYLASGVRVVARVVTGRVGRGERSRTFAGGANVH